MNALLQWFYFRYLLVPHQLDFQGFEVAQSHISRRTIREKNIERVIIGLNIEGRFIAGEVHIPVADGDNQQLWADFGTGNTLNYDWGRTGSADFFGALTGAR